ncbi:hypothetical protein BD779DRAFT_1473169 [Infundibulicybe gibba]|nr:hypothetical protein BD779DRAFT_1473169 [Infundibulicybe gibba]
MTAFLPCDRHIRVATGAPTATLFDALGVILLREHLKRSAVCNIYFTYCVWNIVSGREQLLPSVIVGMPDPHPPNQTLNARFLLGNRIEPRCGGSRYLYTSVKEERSITADIKWAVSALTCEPADDHIKFGQPRISCYLTTAHPKLRRSARVKLPNHYYLSIFETVGSPWARQQAQKKSPEISVPLRYVWLRQNPLSLISTHANGVWSNSAGPKS